jgi:hypothetical protein
MRLRVISSFVVAAAFFPAALSAQSRVSAAAEIGVGMGMGLGGEYEDRRMPALHVAGSVRFRQTSTMAAFAELSADWFDRGHLTNCLLRPGGGCIPWYPGLTGVAATGGVIVRPTAPIEFRLGGGAGMYEANAEPRTAVGAIVGQLDAAFFPSPHFGLVAAGRAIVLPRFRGDLLATMSATAGIRIR